MTLDPRAPTPKTSTTSSTSKQSVISENDIAKYEKDNKTTWATLLHHMLDSLFDIFVVHKSAKTIWDLLHKKYGADNVGRRKYAIGRWLNFKLTDSKTIVEQVHEYENMVTNMVSEGIPVSELLQTYALIEKFPNSWSDFQNKMKHETHDYTMEQLVNHLNIKEAILLRHRSKTFLKTLKLMLWKQVTRLVQRIQEKIRIRHSRTTTTVSNRSI